MINYQSQNTEISNNHLKSNENFFPPVKRPNSSVLPRKLLLRQRNSNNLSTKSFSTESEFDFVSLNQNAVKKLSSSDEKYNLELTSKSVLKAEPVPQTSNKTSLLLIRNNQNKLFKLTFRTFNCHFIPLYMKNRNFVDKDNDKKCQPYSKSVFIEEYTPYLTRFNTTKKIFEINPKYDNRSSVMSFKRKLGASFKKERLPSKPLPGISACRTNLQKPVLYIKAQNINFKLSPKTMSLDFSKPIIEQTPSNFHKDLGLETNEQKKNKGSVIADFRGDILKLSFSMIDINYQQVPEAISRSVQVEDENIYIRSFSTVTERIVQVPLPKKIYNYKDPMVDIRRKNEYLKLHNIEPRWMTETRKNRLENNKQCQQTDQAHKAFEISNGSSVVYEGPGTLNKAREGLIHCQINPEDLEKYEKWVVNSQRENVSSMVVEGENLELFETNGVYDVPDWDLIVYTK